MLFSERLGFKKVEDIILVDRLSETLKNSLANVIYDIFQESWNGNSFFDKFYKVQNFFPYAIPIVLDNEPPRM